MLKIFVLFLYPILIVVCFISPLIVRMIIFGLDVIIPDPLPYVDEFLMAVGIISKFLTGIKIYKFVVRFVIPLAIIWGIGKLFGLW